MNTSTDPLSQSIATALTITPPNEAMHRQRADRWIALVDAIQITTPEEFALAADELRSLSGAAKTLDAERTALVGPLNQVVSALNARFMPYIKLLDGATATLKRKMAAFQEAEQARIAAERRAAEQAAEAERRRLEEQARAERAAAEKAEAEARAAQQAAAAASSAAERAAAEKAAAEAQARAASAAAAAEATATTAAVTTPAVIESTARVAGITTPKTLDFEVTDMAALMRHVLDKQPDLMVLFTLDAAKMRALVKMHGEATSLPGVRVFRKTGISVR